MFCRTETTPGAPTGSIVVTVPPEIVRRYGSAAPRA